MIKLFKIAPTQHTMEQPEQRQPIDILNYFIFDNTEYDLDIIWKNGKPHFRASDIGKVIGLKKIHNSIATFDSDERGSHEILTPGGIQNVVYLTQAGVYSRKH